MKTVLRASALVLLAISAVMSCTPNAERRSPVALDAATPFEASVGATTYYPVTEVVPEVEPVLELTEVVGLLGGRITVAGHTLTVPAGAVSAPTTFTVRALDNGHIEVELHAMVQGLLGRSIDIGAAGFRKPVTVSLTYARATNVTDAQRLKIMRLNANGRHEVLASTVSENAHTVSAQLDHFARYALVSD